MLLSLSAVNELIPVQAQPLQAQADRIQVEDVIPVGQARRRHNLGQVRKRAVVEIGDLLAPGDEAVQPAQLVDAQRRLQIGHVDLEAQRDHLVVPRSGVGVALPGIPAHAMQGKNAHPLGQRSVVRW